MSGTIRKRGRRSWEIRFDVGRDPATGRRRFRYHTVRGTKRDAERALTEALHTRDRGAEVAPTRISCGEYLQRWLDDYARPTLAPATVRRYEQIAERLTRLLGAVPLPRLRPVQIQDAYARLADDGLAARTVLHHHRVLREALHHAVRWQLLAQNPADAVIPPRAATQEMRALRPKEVGVLLGSTDDAQLRAIIHAAVTTGLRLGELLGLQWTDIDFEVATASIRRPARYLSGDGTTTGPPKTARGRRTIALSTETVRILREHRTRQLEHRLASGVVFQDGDWVFPDALGGLQPPYRISDTFRRIVGRTDLGHVRFHDLRHTAATLMMQAGVPTKIVSTRLGHSTAALTLDVYSHVTPDMQRDAAAAIDDILQVRHSIAQHRRVVPFSLSKSWRVPSIWVAKWWHCAGMCSIVELRER